MTIECASGAAAERAVGRGLASECTGMPGCAHVAHTSTQHTQHRVKIEKDRLYVNMQPIPTDAPRLPAAKVRLQCVCLFAHYRMCFARHSTPACTAGVLVCFSCR